MGYIVNSDFHLPPLNLSHEEIIEEIVQLDSTYSESRTVLLKKWRIKEGICEEKEY